MRVSIRELASAILPRNAEPKVLALLRAYLDESYNPRRNPGRMIIAGFIGTASEWDTVGERWANALAKHNAPPFHGSKIAGRHGDYANWPRKNCDALRSDCAEVLASSSLGEIVAGFIGDWEGVLRKCPSIERRFPTEYAFCFEVAVAQMERAAKYWYGGDHIACVFDQNQQYENHAVSVWKSRQAMGQWENITITHANHKSVIQLQCADMIAHESYQAPRLGSANLPLMSALRKRRPALFSGSKQWDETLIPAYQRDPALTHIFNPKETPAPTPEEHDALVAKYGHLIR